MNSEIYGLLMVTSAMEKNRGGHWNVPAGEASQTALQTQSSCRRTVSAKALRWQKTLGLEGVRGWERGRGRHEASLGQGEGFESEIRARCAYKCRCLLSLIQRDIHSVTLGAVKALRTVC